LGHASPLLLSFASWPPENQIDRDGRQAGLVHPEVTFLFNHLVGAAKQ
jgi:hypothetical protein